uniref:allantoinase n=1 Tax=Latimeria chalumnae TaxID=7897 RepID=H3AEL7_LATCH
MELGSEISIVRSSRVVLRETIIPADIVIQDGKIAKILSRRQAAFQTKGKVLDVGNQLVMPGIIDSHVHVNEPGRTAWEGYRTATRAAAAGGVTTIVDMPLNCIPPTTTLENLEVKLQAAKGQCYVDTAFWGGVIPDNESELQPMMKAGVAGFKCFMVPSGVSEFPHVSEMHLTDAMAELKDTGTVLLFHAEKELHSSKSKPSDPCEYKTFLDSRPDEMEVEAIWTVSELCLRYNVRCHIVHLSSAKALPIIEKARQAGAPLTVETTHHYLNLSAAGIPGGATLYKSCPPIRGRDNQERLWSALKAGQIDMVVSDHSPCTADLKQLESGDFMAAWGGISSLQFGLSLFWTSAKRRGFSLPDLVKLMCQNPAQLCRLEGRKGVIAPGMDADIVIWDPEKQFEIKEELIHHKTRLTPYLGFQLQGEVLATIVRGKLVYFRGRFSPQALGKSILVDYNMPEIP